MRRCARFCGARLLHVNLRSSKPARLACTAHINAETTFADARNAAGSACCGARLLHVNLRSSKPARLACTAHINAETTFADARNAAGSACCGARLLHVNLRSSKPACLACTAHINAETTFAARALLWSMFTARKLALLETHTPCLHAPHSR